MNFEEISRNFYIFIWWCFDDFICLMVFFFLQAVTTLIHDSSDTNVYRILNRDGVEEYLRQKNIPFDSPEEQSRLYDIDASNEDDPENYGKIRYGFDEKDYDNTLDDGNEDEDEDEDEDEHEEDEDEDDDDNEDSNENSNENEYDKNSSKSRNLNTNKNEISQNKHSIAKAGIIDFLNHIDDNVDNIGCNNWTQRAMYHGIDSRFSNQNF